MHVPGKTVSITSQPSKANKAEEAPLISQVSKKNLAPLKTILLK